MASPLYGCISPSVTTQEYEVAASQYFYHDAPNLVNIDGNGQVTLLETADTTAAGVAIVPKGRGVGTSDSYWLSSATAGSDKIAVITDPSAKYLLPADDTVTAAMKGNACDLTAANDGNGAGEVNVGTSSTDIFIIDDLGSNYGGDSTDVVVHINPTKFQADT